MKFSRTFWLYSIERVSKLYFPWILTYCWWNYLGVGQMETENWKSWRLPHRQTCQTISGIVSLLSQTPGSSERPRSLWKRMAAVLKLVLLDGFPLWLLLRSRSIYQLNYLFMYDSMPDFELIWKVEFSRSVLIKSPLPVIESSRCWFDIGFNNFGLNAGRMWAFCPPAFMGVTVLVWLSG